MGTRVLEHPDDLDLLTTHFAYVSFWNLHDGQSWLNAFPWRRVNLPLLFDRQRQPKPAFGRVVRVLAE